MSTRHRNQGDASPCINLEGHHVPGRRQLPRPGGLLLLPQRLPLLLRVRAPRSGGSDTVVGASKLDMRTYTQYLLRGTLKASLRILREFQTYTRFTIVF